jgi:hypothetical protein
VESRLTLDITGTTNISIFFRKASVNRYYVPAERKLRFIWGGGSRITI